METNNLKKMISAILDIEINLKVLESSIDDLSQRMTVLGKKKLVEKPTLNLPEKRVVKKIHLSDKKQETRDGWSWVIAIAVGIVGGLGTSYHFSNKDYLFTIVQGFIFVPIFLFVGLILSIILFKIIDTVKKGTINKEESDKHRVAVIQAEKNYEKAMQAYEINQKKEECRINKELQIRTLLEADINKLNDIYSKELSHLKKLYDSLDILPQYRNIIAIGYMYDLLQIGSATQLSGPNQLYEKVRRDMREDRIPIAIGEISVKLDTIIDQNNRLFSVLQNIEDTQRNLSESINKESQNFSRLNSTLINEVKNSNAVLEYEAARIRKGLEYQNLLIKYPAVY